MNLKDVLIRPVITEKTTSLQEDNKYVFKIDRRANKILVKQAVKSLFAVDAKSVNIQIVRGKKKRNKFTIGQKPSWKRAIVTLKLGDKIELFEK
ncbi:MAG: 50S ribosomal protein L23 [Spirochaetes bacterium]|jgi:large subunit ribosomal protein L23|nr:50S ribosomal protein L23 [Spirochaetota bacterium]